MWGANLVLFCAARRKEREKPPKSSGVIMLFYLQNYRVILGDRRFLNKLMLAGKQILPIQQNGSSGPMGMSSDISNTHVDITNLGSNDTIYFFYSATEGKMMEYAMNSIHVHPWNSSSEQLHLETNRRIAVNVPTSLPPISCPSSINPHYCTLPGQRLHNTICTG